MIVDQIKEVLLRPPSADLKYPFGIGGREAGEPNQVTPPRIVKVLRAMADAMERDGGDIITQGINFSVDATVDDFPITTISIRFVEKCA